MESSKRYSLRTRNSLETPAKIETSQSNGHADKTVSTTSEITSQECAATPVENASSSSTKVKVKEEIESPPPSPKALKTTENVDNNKIIIPKVNGTNDSHVVPGEAAVSSMSENSSSNESAPSNVFETMYKKLFKKSPKRRKYAKSQKSHINTARCYPYAYYRKRKSNSISAKMVIPISDDDDIRDYLDWKPCAELQREKTAAKNEKLMQNKDKNTNEQMSLSSSETTEQNTSEPLSIPEPTLRNEESHTAKVDGQKEESELRNGTEEAMKTNENDEDSEQEDHTDEDNIECNGILYSRISLEKDCSFDELYNFQPGMCACQRCKRRQEFNNLDKVNYIQEILSKNETYPNLAQFVQFHLERKAKKNSELNDLVDQLTKFAQDKVSVPQTETTAMASDEPEMQKLLPPPSQPKLLLNDNLDSMVIIRKSLGNGEFSYKAVSQSSLKTLAPGKQQQQFARFVSNTSPPKIATNSRVKPVDTFRSRPKLPIPAPLFSTSRTISSESITTSSNLISKPLDAQSIVNPERKRIHDEQMDRIRKVSRQIASTLSKSETGENEITRQESESKGLPQVKPNYQPLVDNESLMIANFVEEEPSEPSTTTIYIPDSGQLSPSRAVKSRESKVAPGGYRPQRRFEYVPSTGACKEGDKFSGLYEEDESFELSYTTGLGKSPLIITLYLKCPLAQCERLFSARNDDGCTVNITYQIAEHLAVAHGIHFPAQCLICEERFPKDHLKWHIRSVHETGAENERFQCRHCPDTFLDCYEKLVKHWNKKHIQGRFMCAKEGCEHIAEFKIDIYRHLAKAHHEYKCSVCGLTFQYRSTLMRHEMQHSGYHKFACGYGNCRFTTTSKGGCLQHIRVRHLGLPLTRKSDPNAENPNYARLEKEALTYVYFFDDETGELLPASQAQRMAHKPSGLIRTVRKKVLVMKRTAKEDSLDFVVVAPKESNSVEEAETKGAAEADSEGTDTVTDSEVSNQSEVVVKEEPIESTE